MFFFPLQSAKIHGSDEEGNGLAGRTNCFITSRLTFSLSTFLEYSGGNLVLLRSFASTPLAMTTGLGGETGEGQRDE